jgi:hypothetical protein
MENRIDAVLSDESLNKIRQHTQGIRAELPFTVDLTADDRQSLVKLGEKSRAFAEGSLTLVEQDDSFMPRSFDKAEMRQDKTLYDQLDSVETDLTQLLESVRDTKMLVGSDRVMNSLEVYRNAKANGKGANLDDLVPLLARRFKRKPKTDDDDEGGETPTE